jgi:hypothetical protein
MFLQKKKKKERKKIYTIDMKYDNEMKKKKYLIKKTIIYHRLAFFF